MKMNTIHLSAFFSTNACVSLGTLPQTIISLPALCHEAGQKMNKAGRRRDTSLCRLGQCHFTPDEIHTRNAYSPGAIHHELSAMHLLVLIHGMWGEPNHLAELDQIIKSTKGHQEDIELRVLLAETNSKDSTYDGIDWGGERVTSEVIKVVEQIKEEGEQVTQFSITGYSLGGLIARYVVGALHQKGFFKDITPVNFNTFATPHVGLPRFPSLLSSVLASLGPKLLSRTGEQFYYTDKWSTSGKPLLEVMADPNQVFYQALNLFPHIRIYGNAIHDRTVPYISALIIDTDDPFSEYETNGIDIKFRNGYEYLVESWSLPKTPPPKPVALSSTWFHQLRPSRPFLPPHLQFRFPFNVALYATLPVFLPAAVSYVVVKIYFSARSSRMRVKLLEEGESNSTKLAYITAKIEEQLEDIVVDLSQEPESQALEMETQVRPSDKKKELEEEIPLQRMVFTPLQQKVATNLNKLPNLKKETAFFRDAQNAHGPIICRDVKRFPGPQSALGKDVIRHWADYFVL